MGIASIKLGARSRLLDRAGVTTSKPEPSAPGPVVLPGERRVVRFVVPGDPVTWKRARRGPRGSYTDPRDAEHREKIRACARNAGIRSPLLGRVRMDVRIFTSLDPLDARVGDRDNYEKAIKDALQGIAFANDRQVCAGETTKEQDAANPRTEVEITEAA